MMTKYRFFNHMKTYHLILIVLMTGWLGCSNNNTEEKEEPGANALTAQEIVDNSITWHGGDHYNNMFIQFDFRDKAYTIKKNGGNFEYTRQFVDETGRQFLDKLNNDGFTRAIDGEVYTGLPEERANAFASSVGSVAYFTLLPFGLNDAAVNKTLIGKTEMEGKSHYKIKVTFDQEGGGEDFTDIYLFWFSVEDFALDYLAYDYETGDGTMRFRKVLRRNEVGPFKFNDYINFKPVNLDLDFMKIDSVYAAGGVKELSRIENKNIELLKQD
jgi:uncharacterized protein DUF6503